MFDIIHVLITIMFSIVIPHLNHRKSSNQQPISYYSQTNQQFTIYIIQGKRCRTKFIKKIF